MNPVLDFRRSTWFLVNRGKVQGPAFFDRACFDYFQLRLLNCLKVYHVNLHAYVLLPNGRVAAADAGHAERCGFPHALRQRMLLGVLQ